MAGGHTFAAAVYSSSTVRDRILSSFASSGDFSRVTMPAKNFSASFQGQLQAWGIPLNYSTPPLLKSQSGFLC
eukprot:1578344-Amphidinium_carterae.1